MVSNYVVFGIITLICDYCTPLCNNTFQNTLAEVSFDGTTYLQESLNGCLENRPLKTVLLKGYLPGLYSFAISHMYELEQFYIDGVGLRYLFRDFIMNVPKLRTISINLNPLSTLEENQFQDFILSTLNLSQNMIERIEGNVFLNVKLRNLDMSNNRLVSVNRDAFKNSEISILYIQYNNIVYLTKHVFDGVKSVEEIHLNNNNIYYIEDMTFMTLGRKSLTYLSLRGNALTQIDFLSDTSLKYLDVGLNKISYLFFKNTTSIQIMRICPNPWHCKCLRDFWNFAKVHGIIIEEGAIQYDVGPVCIAETRECKEDYNYDKLRETYFQEFNYEKYWNS